ncbi:hypothetical protein HY639_05250 [Candidatus Woesearchaeota archaeon]|nr:hypothetical protein [Candidatus Woesearchaeota archaeon]
MKKGMFSLPLWLIVIVLFVILFGYFNLPRLAEVGCEQDLLLGLIGKVWSKELDIDHCIKGAAVFFKEPAMCNRIKGPSTTIGGKEMQLENPPKMECYTEIAALTKNPELCEKVEGIAVANTKIDCLFRVATRAKDASICDRIGDREQSRMGFMMNMKTCKTRVGG